MQTIHATVKTRLLAKASRLFSGSLSGRIVEILQNARRAGPRNFVITNQNGAVTVGDDPRGIDDADWSVLLHLALRELHVCSTGVCGANLRGRRESLAHHSRSATPSTIYSVSGLTGAAIWKGRLIQGLATQESDRDPPIFPQPAHVGRCV